MSTAASSKLWKFPWSFLMIIYLMVTYFTGIPLEGVMGYILIALGMFVLFIEFFKSGDVSSALFFVDQLFSVSAVIISTVLLTYLFIVENQVPNFFYWFGYAVILGDAVLSPFNAFRTALRNFGVSGQ